MLSHYAEVSGRQVDDIDYYCVLAKWKLAIVLEQGYQRAGDDPKLQTFGPVVLELMQGAAELAETTRLQGVRCGPPCATSTGRRKSDSGTRRSRRPRSPKARCGSGSGQRRSTSRTYCW